MSDQKAAEIEEQFQECEADRNQFDQPFNGRKDKRLKRLEDRNAQLRTKLANKDEVIAEIMASHIELKKNLGEI